MKALTIGADPEFFLRDAATNKFHSAFGLIPGDKSNPAPVENGAIQVDGMAVEFNIDPAKNEIEFVHNVTSVLSTLREMIPVDYDFARDTVVKFEDKHMKTQPNEALVLGCEPDFDAYTGEHNPDIPDPGNMRVAGGHIHIGFTEDADPNSPQHLMACCKLAKQLDYTIGLLGTILDPQDQERKNMYGKAGSFRPKPYGMEYRTLSSFWMHTDENIRMVYRGVEQGVELLRNGIVLDEKFEGEAKAIINNGDKIQASDLYHLVQLTVYEFRSRKI